MGSRPSRSRICLSGGSAGFLERENVRFFEMGSQNHRMLCALLRWVCENYRISRGVLWCPNAEVKKTLVFHVVSPKAGESWHFKSDVFYVDSDMPISQFYRFYVVKSYICIHSLDSPCFSIFLVPFWSPCGMKVEWKVSYFTLGANDGISKVS